MALPGPEFLSVEVVYAPPGAVEVFAVKLAQGACARDAVIASGVLQAYPALRIDALDLGVFNRPCGLELVLKNGDRLEIYRPLQIEPKAARHLRVAARRKAESAARSAPASGDRSGATGGTAGSSSVKERPKPAR